MEVAVRGARDPPISVEDQYQYEPLVAGDAVRVLNLEPAEDFQSPLCGFITQHQPAVELLDPNGYRYSAVSYTWGDPTPSQKLFLRLDTEWTFLPITRNADSLLRYLRVAHKKKTLWIDGICLNQKDEEEKTDQIRVMGQIYAYAKKVHIWLGGNEMEDAQQAFSLMRRIEFDESRTLDPATHEFLCLERLFNRPWFTRRWVVQETFFSHNAIFHCGHHTLSLSCVMAVLAKATIQGWTELPGLGLRMLRSTIGVGQMQSPRQGLLSLLWDLHESECTERRDRVAALYSLSDTLERPPLHYDIGDWKIIYKDVASYYANYSAVTSYTLLLHLCSFGSIHSSTASEIPSWVPDWSKKRQELIASEARQAEGLYHNSIGTPSPETRAALDIEALRGQPELAGPKFSFFRFVFRIVSEARQHEADPYHNDFGMPSARPRAALPIEAWNGQPDSADPRMWFSQLVFPRLRRDLKQWKQKQFQYWQENTHGPGRIPRLMKVQVLGHKLQLNYDFLAFVSGCGIVDQVVYPSQSENFWDEVMELVWWRKKKRPAGVVDCLEWVNSFLHTNKRHRLELDSLSSLFICLLESRIPTLTNVTSDLRDFVGGLCTGLLHSHGHNSKFQALAGHRRRLIQVFRSAMGHLVIARVQVTLGYYWAIGPPNLGKGDWFVPLIRDREGVPLRPEPNITQCMCLRSIGSVAQENAWYPSPGFDLDWRLFFFDTIQRFEWPEVDPVHVTAKFVGSGGSCFHLFDYKLHRDPVIWRISLRATEAASRKGLPGPIIFDIV